MNRRLEYWNTGILEDRAACPSYAHRSSIPSFHRSRRPAVRRQQGIALLMVLLLVVAITILATGFLAGTDTELLSGANTLLRVQMDQLAESGLEQGRGLVLHPQDVTADLTSFNATAQQLTPRSADYAHDDYYDVHITQDKSRPFDNCTYDIKCEAYRQLVTGGTTNVVGWSGLDATLRLDPCVALAVGASTWLWGGVTVQIGRAHV
jgi:Tfp pilus assembly protein PilX